jgi:hypothetical protein
MPFYKILKIRPFLQQFLQFHDKNFVFHLPYSSDNVYSVHFLDNFLVENRNIEINLYSEKI